MGSENRKNWILAKSLRERERERGGGGKSFSHQMFILFI